jgi:Zn-dependent peptidase ImmA (M78 family)
MGEIVAQSVRVAVEPNILEWALSRAGMDVASLPEKKSRRVAKWLAQEEQPTLRQLESFAATTMAPLGYFFLKEPPREQLPVPDFRTVRDTGLRQPSPNLLETIYMMQRRQAWLREDRIEQGIPPLPFIRSTTPLADPAVVGQSIRRALKLVAGWSDVLGTWTDALSSFRDRIEGLGVVVVFNGIVGNNTHRKLDPDEFRGFVLVDNYAPLIFVNGSDSKAAQMFTLAHELAHLWIGQGGLFDLPRLEPANLKDELFCNRVAAEVLIPAAEMADAWADLGPQYQRLARRFKVSEIVVARRALDLGLIVREEFFQFYETYLNAERRKPKSKGGDFYATQKNRVGRVFGEAVGRAAQTGRLLYRDAFALTGLTPATFDKYLKLIGV